MKPNIYLIGNAHLDPAWLWRLDEGFEAFLATCRSALERMQETPSFIFTCSSAACYNYVEQTDPGLFKQIQEAVQAGRWEIVGGWWVEPDCNIPLGESFVRQALYGQRYFMSRFGKTCTVGYCIDSFGHNANLPQLLSRAGMNSYIFMRPERDELELPSNLFRWRATSGDEVTAFRIPFHYSNFRHSVGEKLDLLIKQDDFRGATPWMLFYGVGNHGGGPTKQQIAEILARKMTMNRTDAFFSEAEKMKEHLSVYRGELQHHAIGCYSNHSALKAANRKAEHALLRAEKLGVLSESITGQALDYSEFDRAWKNVLLNQFHDILGGVSTEEVIMDAFDCFGEAIAIASRSERISLQRIRNGIDTSDAVESLIVFNPHFQKYNGLIEFELWNSEGGEKERPIEGVMLITESGKHVDTQQIESKAKIGPDRVRFLSMCEIPPFGWRRYKLQRSSTVSKQPQMFATDRMLKNGRIGFSIERKEGSAEDWLFYTPLEVFKDLSDTWSHGVTSYSDKLGEFSLRKVEVIEEGPIRAKLRLISQYNSSTCEQNISLYDTGNEIIIETLLDWREPHAVCKMSFIHGMNVLHFHSDIPYGVIERQCDSKEYPVTSWAFVSDGRKGLGVLSDSKSSFSCDGNKLSFVAARSSLYAHHEPPHVLKPSETLRYLDHGIQQFTTKIVLGHTTYMDAQMVQKSLEFHEPPVAAVESSHAGVLPNEYSGGSDLAGGVVVTSLKPGIGEKGAVVRLWNSTNDTKQTEVEISTLRNTWRVTLSPYEIKSYRLLMDQVQEVTLIEDFLP